MVNKTGVSALRQSRRNSCAGACLLTWLCMGWLVTNVAAQQGDLHPSISALLDQMIVVPASDTQPGGPSHTFRISQFEVTNEQFVAFLNHALAHPDDPSGAYIYVDANTGDVCVSNGATGSIGGTPCDPERIYFRPSVGGRVTFDGQNFQLASGPFGYGAHPVVGVTWYGATKFCNWLTLQAGWGIDEQAYIETTAANIDDWRPATISPSSWAQRGLNNAEREDLIQLWGFRLPMDGGAGNPNTFNEWYKAAAAFGDPATFQALYGFGRNQIENADANIRCSGDVFEDPVKCQVGGTTPVGHFDGVSLLSDGSTTNDTNNAYGLYDITGNVWEWVQEKVVGEFGDRRTRGGSYLSSNTFASLGFDTFRFADSAEANVGFRVAQAVPHALYVRPQGGLTISGPWGGHYDVTRNSDQEELGSEVSVTVENYTGQSVSLMISTNANWLLPADSDMWTVDPDASLQIPFAVTLSCDTPLAAGTYEAAITFTDLADGSNQTLPVTLDITTPASIETTESGAMERVYRSSVLATTLQVANASALPINVTARALDVDDAGILDWVTLREELSPTSFEVQPELFYALPVTFDLEALAVALESEEPVTGLVQARIQITDECTGDLHEQNVSVNVQPIFSIEAQQPLAFTASAGSEATPDSFEVTIKNLLDNWVEWQATVEPISPDDSVDWLRISSTQGSIRPQKTTTLRLETTPDVERLAEGTYEVALRLSSGDYQLTRDVSVTITALQVEPEEGLEFTGLRGGPFEPESIEYTVTNAGLLPLEWRASLAVDCDAEPRQALSWLQIEPEAGIIELPQGTRTVTIEPDPLIAPLLSQNAYQAEICFDSFDPNAPNDTLLASTFRAVLFEVGTDPRFETVEVPATDTLADGPEHSFRIGRYEVTNELYVEFLNDALADLGGFRGQYMFFDETTGEVFINDTVNGQRGEADEDLQQKLFDPAINPGIEFAEGEYRVLSSPFDYRYHPVTGVSWYGALKYCNWLTLEAGLPSEQRIYGEGTNEELTSWRPITISPEDWEIRSMSDAEYDALLLLWGYRLPLDESDGTVSPYNEWSKFATASSANGALAFDAVYGFGRDAITGADANFRCSGDPFEDEFKCQLGGTSPVGFFDGIQQLVDGPTNPTDNAYSLHDVSGNVWEWMQGDTGNENRWVRGGAFNSLAGFLATSERVIREADAVDQATGFRIAHTNPARLRVEPFSNYQESGVWGSLLRGDDDRFVIQVTNVTDTPVEFLLQAIEPWVQFEGTTTGLVEPRTAVTAEVLVDYPCDQSLSTGAQSSNIRVVDIEQATETQRNISLSFSEPLQISPNSGINVDREFGGDSPSIIYTIENTSAIDMTVTATATDPEITDGPATWVSINGEAGEIEWTIAPGDVIEVEVILLVPLLPKGVHQASIRFENECTGNAVTRNQVIDILPLFDVEATTEAVFSGGIGGPFEPESVEVSLINRVDRPIDWMVSFVPIEPTKTATWIEADPAEGTLQSVNDEVTINLSMTVAATELPADAYAATIRFSTPEGFVDEYVVGLNIAQLTLTPSEGTTFSGPRNGPFTPVDVKYTVLNPEFKDFEWQATILEDCDADEPTAIDWLEVTPSQGVIGIPGATAEMTVSVTNQALALQTGEYEAYLCVSQIDPTDPNGAVLTTAERRMKLDVGTSAFSLPMTMIEDEPAPAEGPTHRFRWATTEVTNSDFARFLNDVEVDGGESPRSRNVARDPDSGTLTILDDGTLLYQTNADNEESRIEYDPLAPLGIRYKADVAYGNHPVNFVSWYGAVKYCNWLTHVQGMADQIVYLEGPTAADWRPVTDDPKSLLELFGFRLPMDGGAEEAGEHNEWYKVASARFDEENEYTFDAIYGFGRDEIGNEDANFLNSGDPFDGSTTPVGFYDGRTYNGGGDGTIGNGNEFSTAPNINAYGIHDLSGNVSEWMHDRDPQHVVRGGNLDNAASSDRLKVVSRAFFAPQSVSRAIGFRVAQSVPVTIDDLALSRTKAPIRISGFVGGPMEFVTEGAVSEASVEIQNASAFAADDIAITLTPSGTPLQFVGATPQLVPANQQAVIRLVLDETRTGIGPSPAPPGNFKLVTGEQTPDGGPVHDFWINENEVTNSGFAAFLNDLLGNITGDPEDQDERSDFIYIDSLTGNVYLHDEQEGTLGLGPPAQGIQLYDMTCEDLTYDGEEYETVSARNNWPVRCLNWFACVKYCNWLSQSDGIPQELRAYSEGSAQELEAWRPITMSVEQWNNGPGDAERQVLIENTMGYRLPMDANASVHERFNEWYKAAAWQPLENIDSVYGFGRDELNPVDANIMGNQDTEEDSPTPVGFFNGTNNLYNPPATCETPQSDATSTASGDNGYELQDITGNVAEWMQSPGSDAGHQNVRGGSWKDMTDSLRLRNDNIATLLATETRDDVGFRLVRGPGRVIKLKVENRTSGQSVELPFILDLKEPFSTLPREDVMLSGMYGDDFNTISETFDTINRSNTDMEIELTSAVEWLDVDDGSSEEEEDPITLTGLETLAWTVQSNESINELPPGEHTTSILIKNETTLQTRSRQFIIDIAKPFDVLPATGEPESPRFVGLVGGPFEVVDSKENAPDQVVYELTNLSTVPLTYTVASSVNWMEIEPVNPADGMAGDLPVGSSISFAVSMSVQAENLNPGRRSADAIFTIRDPAQDTFSTDIRKSIELEVNDAIAIERECQPCGTCGQWRILADGSSDTICTERLTLTNIAIADQSQRELSIQVDQDWLQVDITSIDLLPGDTNAVTIEITSTDQVFQQHQGEYTATVTITDVTTGSSQCREIQLTVIETLATNPFETYSVRGLAGQPANPPFKVYTLTNVAETDEAIDWSACADSSWLTLSGAGTPCDTIPAGCVSSTTLCGTLAPGEIAQVVVTVDTNLDSGDYQAALLFNDETNNFTVTRAVSAEIVTSVVLQDSQEIVSRQSLQPSGPAYDFIIDAHPITNAKFVAFLNDALNRPDELAGQYLYFDTDNGDVYMNDTQQGESGAGPDGRETHIFSPAVNTMVTWQGGAYEVNTDPQDFNDHPVTGVSWYGALKFCNWLTVDQGLFPEDRCYGEGTANQLSTWRPITISPEVWASRGMNDNERLQLVADCRGYRLPMDDGANNTSPGTDEADDYNEWYKAAAWNTSRNKNTDFGMGIDEGDQITGAHANFRCSNDPFENIDDCMEGGTTPVGFFDGTNLLSDGTPTIDTNNEFGLYDMSGNVFHWMQDQFEGDGEAVRAIRGGSYRWTEAQLITRMRAWKGADTPSVDLGFRVLRAVPATPGDIDGNLSVDLLDHNSLAGCLSGPDAVLPVEFCDTFDLATGLDGDVDLADFAVFQTSFDGN